MITYENATNKFFDKVYPLFYKKSVPVILIFE